MHLFAVLKNKETLGATLLVTGCCIGAGMIGLPVISALAGFMPTTLAMILCYLFTTASGLLLLEATLWFDEEINLPSIVQHTLGIVGKSITLILFLFLFYCLFVAYLDGGAVLFSDLLASLFDRPISREIGMLTCVGLVGGITYAGTKVVDNLNRGLLIGLVVSYCTLLVIGLPAVNKAHLTYMDWTATLSTVPILLICFGYQNLVPSLTYYLKKNIPAIRCAIIIGNLIPFFIYSLWNFVILGLLSTHTLIDTSDTTMVTELLQTASQSLPIIFFVKAFSLFAMLTSFIPNAMSFIDFLRDGFKKTVLKKSRTHFLLYGFVFVPPLIAALLYPNVFLKALGFAGGFIDVLLFGVLPATIILVGRYQKKMVGPYQVLGSYYTPLFILVLSLSILMMKLF